MINPAPLVIAAPFGNFIHLSNVSSTFGSFTLKPRPGRWTRAIKTIRPYQGGVVNNIGLRNIGIVNMPNPKSQRHIVSIAALAPEDWQQMAAILQQHRQNGYQFGFVELNLSCPNATIQANVIDALPHFNNFTLIAKLPPKSDSLHQAKMLVDAGITRFTLTNTLPTSKGGLSGKPLKPHSLQLIRDFRKRFGDQPYVIGGGGITNTADIVDYKNAGADSVFIASVCFKPWKIYPLKKIVATNNE